MPSRLSVLPCARTAMVAAALGLAVAGCSPVTSVENADVPKWRATALPSSPAGVVLQDSGKILNRNRIVQEAARVPAGSYTLTAVCDGTGKAFFAVTLDGKAVAEAGAACNGRQETTKISLPAAGRVEISSSSVDAPLLYAYQLVPAQ
ncbi:hypothetical protein QFZ35_001493 [Arthrobacter ulcerisalmonis]|uniref:hypothetical protein n=1 Tax=Arthrobacter sp. B1I2 TaxID=3042263 RepID=UPI0027803AF3|nr:MULTISPECIES: hypothetical protein [Arthrobacter]MDQ0662995.1 hypothetical protein [Arthrobacter ulcerisalmonis]MDQ0730899.1 hypothetical protein [Arthrobacter sp. B1I2]